MIAHVGSHSIEDARTLARRARDLDLAGVSTLAPSYFTPATLNDLIEWCAAIAKEAPELPFYYYDIPAMTGVSFPMEHFLVEAPARIPNLAGIKITKLTPEGREKFKELSKVAYTALLSQDQIQIFIDAANKSR